MPNYDYDCLECGKTFEVFQKISDKPLAKCVYCSGKTKRLIGGGYGIIFKGSGFYETDYKRKKPQPLASQKKECKNCPETKCASKEGN